MYAREVCVRVGVYVAYKAYKAYTAYKTAVIHIYTPSQRLTCAHARYAAVLASMSRITAASRTPSSLNGRIVDSPSSVWLKRVKTGLF